MNNNSSNFSSNAKSILNGNKNPILLNSAVKSKTSENRVGNPVHSFDINYLGIKEEMKGIAASDRESLKNNMSSNRDRTFKDIFESIPKSKTYLTSLKKPDDLLFAQNEISSIDKKLEKSKLKDLKIWEKKKDPFEIDEKEVSIRKKITEIKKNAQEKGGLSSINFKNQSYFNKNNLNLISESTRIVQEKTLQNSRGKVPGKSDSLYHFIIDNREISMKNFILDLLKSERTLILTKEGEVSKALKDSNGKLEDDYKRFENFTEYERSKQKEMDKILLESAKDNRELADKKKKLVQDNKQIMDELERTVKSIKNFKSDAIFVHYVLGDLKSIQFKNDINVLDKKNFDFNEISQKDSDYEKITEELIAEFSYVEKEKKHIIPELLQDNTQMLQTFLEMEENILKLMDSKQNFDKETEKMIIENKQILIDLADREKVVRKEREKLFQDKEKEDKIMKDLVRSTTGEGSNYDIVNMLKELYFITIYGEDFETLSSNKRIKIKPNLDIKELMEQLRGNEFKIIEYIEELDEISKEDGDKFRKIIYNRKEFNKFMKQEDQKKKTENINIMKKEKAEERMHRVIVKGRNPMQHVIAVKGETKKQTHLTLNKENDDYNNMIYDEYND